MNLHGLYNCSVTVFKQNITFLQQLNRSELLSVLHDALDSSMQPEVLRDTFLECLFNFQERPFDLQWWQKLFWSVIFVAMLFVATVGNVIVIWIVLGENFIPYCMQEYRKVFYYGTLCFGN